MLIPDGATVPDRATVFYTPQVVNTPRHIEHGIQTQRYQLRMLAVESWLENQRRLYQLRKRAEALLSPRRLELHRRPNVLILPEEVCRVVGLLHLHQAAIVVAVGGADAFGFVCTEVIDVHASGGVGF